MTSAFDQRIIQVGVEIDGTTYLYEGLDIRASGTKYLSPTNNNCTIRLSNLTRDHRNYILTKATPLNAPGRQRQTVNISLDVGRESYGTFRLFEGAAWAMGATQPPDIGIILEGLTNNLAMSLINTVSFAAATPLKTIAQKIADQNGLALDFRVANNKNIANYSYTGPVGKQVQKLSEMGDVIAHVDGKTLHVIDTSPTLGADDPVILLNQNTGMIGVPQPNMGGVIVKCLITSSIKLGTRVNIQSEINPSVNGEYTVWNINFDVANRDQPFWYTLFCRNDIFFRGSQ